MSETDNTPLETAPRNKEFSVGIGAQNAGTSWLAEYLDGHAQVGFSPIKELQYF